MSIVEAITIKTDICTQGAYLRWYYNGWHHKLFSNRYTTTEESKVNGKQVVEMFSSISRVEKNTSRESKIYINLGETNISQDDIEIYKGLLVAETVQLFQLNQWIKLDIDRGSFAIKPTKLNKFVIEFRAEVMEILANDLVFSPVSQPVEVLLFEDYFDNWVIDSPYDSIPVNWVNNYPPLADLYVEPAQIVLVPLSAVGLKMNKEAITWSLLYVKVGINRPINPTQSGTFRVVVKVTELYHSGGNLMSLIATFGNKSMTINSVGEFEATFNDVIGFNKFDLTLNSVGGGTRNANVEYVKIYKIL